MKTFSYKIQLIIYLQVLLSKIDNIKLGKVNTFLSIKRFGIFLDLDRRLKTKVVLIKIRSLISKHKNGF